MMKTKTLIKALLGTSVLTVFTAVAAHAGGTAAGTEVKNTFTLDYRVGGINQPQISTCQTGDAGCGAETSTNFTVDRLVDLTVASQGDTTVFPGSSDQDIVFSLTNDGNDTHAYALTLVNEGSDQFSAQNKTLYYYVDDGDGTYEPGAGDGAPTAYNGSSTPDLGADEILWVIVQSDIQTGVNDADEDVLSVVADTLNAGTTTATTADGDGNSLTGAAENVLADGSGTSNEASNAGDHSATAKYIVASADIDGAKTVSIHTEDGSNCATIPGTPVSGGYSVPGACVEYVITVENTGATQATNVQVNDVLSENLTFIAAQADGFTGGSFSSPSLPSSGTSCTSGGNCEINFTGATLAGGSVATPTTATVKIRALVK